MVEHRNAAHRNTAHRNAAHRDATLDRTFSALADPTRRALLDRLRNGPATVGELAAPFDVSLAAISKHLQVLERAGLLRREVRGREHHCSLDAAPLSRAADFTARYAAFWEERLDALETYLRRRRPTARRAARRKGSRR